MDTNSRSTNQGLTLIETLVYIGLLAVIMSCFTSYAFGIYSVNSDTIEDIHDAYLQKHQK